MVSFCSNIDDVEADNDIAPDKGSTSAEQNEASPCVAVKEDVCKEIPKMKLLELGKTSLEAQFANAQYNNFTGLLAAKVKTYHLEGKVIFLTHHIS